MFRSTFAQFDTMPLSRYNHNVTSFRSTAFADKNPANFLSFYHLNVRSLRDKEDEMCIFFSSLNHKFDGLAFSETWFSGSQDAVTFAGYKCESISRDTRKGGGVALYISNKFSYQVIPEYTIMNRSFECLFVKSSAFVAGVIYRPPSGSLPEFFEFLESLLDYLASVNSHVVILGDFNIDLLHPCESVNEFLDIVTSNGFSNLIDAPTRITGTSETLIDLCLTNINTDQLKSGVLTSDISDHLSIFCLIPKLNSYACNTNATPVTFRVITNDTIETFREMVSTVDWGGFTKLENSNLLYDSFLSKITEIYDCAFPAATIKKCKKARKPWITRELLQRIKARNALFNKFIVSRDLGILKEFKKVRNKLNADIKKSRIRYYTDRFADVSNDPRRSWRIVKDLLRKTHTSVPVEMKIGEQVVTGKALSNEFNRHFLSLGATDSVTAKQPEKYINSNLVHSIFLHPATPTEIVGIISKLKNNCSCGFDGIKAAPIKAVANIIADVVCHITNVILSTGIFPDKMKVARVSVLYKSGAVDCISNYRPISVLPLFSKIVEKVINSRITSHLNKYNLISANQYGFQKNKSTEMALLNIREKLVDNIEKQLYTLGIFLDFSKAFDSIKHEILYVKLPYYGIRGLALELIRSYLSYRKQYVLLHNMSSDTEYIKFGVPQGSILGPILFILYINDIVNIPHTPEIVLYADDTNVFFSSRNISSLVSLTNSWLESLSQWLRSNQLHLNINKTKYIVFRSINRTVTLTDVITFESKPLERVSDHKFLGVVFHEHLRWGCHASSIKRNIAQHIGMLNKFRALLPTRIKKQLYFAYVHARLHYCLLVWGVASKSLMVGLHRMQKKGVRFIHNLSNYTNTYTYFQQDCILDVQSLYNQRLAETIFLKFNTNPELFLFNFTNTEEAYNFRHKNFIKPRTRTNYGTQTLKWQIPNLLNNHPVLFDMIEHTSSVHALKRKTKMYFLHGV